MQRAHEVLYYVGLGEARYRNIETYSTGMKQRIKLAQAIVHDPDLLFLDEPTNGMDPKGRDEMLELIHDLAHHKNVNLILSSHLLPDVEFTCDHVVVMDKGTVATYGPIDALKGTHRPRLRVAHQGRRRRSSSSVLKAAGYEVQRHATKTCCGCSCPARPTTAPRCCSRWPRASGCRCATCVRACRRSKTSSPARWGRSSRMPIHDQGYQRYVGIARRIGRVVAGDDARRRDVDDHQAPVSSA